MAKTKSTGKVRQKTDRPGRHLGVKVFGGQIIKPGQIIVRQRGTIFHPGDGVALGRDFTLFALKRGKVVFKEHGEKKVVSIV